MRNLLKKLFYPISTSFLFYPISSSIIFLLIFITLYTRPQYFYLSRYPLYEVHIRGDLRIYSHFLSNAIAAFYSDYCKFPENEYVLKKEALKSGYWKKFDYYYTKGGEKKEIKLYKLKTQPKENDIHFSEPIPANSIAYFVGKRPNRAEFVSVYISDPHAEIFFEEHELKILFLKYKTERKQYSKTVDIDLERSLSCQKYWINVKNKSL